MRIVRICFAIIKILDFGNYISIKFVYWLQSGSGDKTAIGPTATDFNFVRMQSAAVVCTSHTKGVSYWTRPFELLRILTA